MEFLSEFNHYGGLVVVGVQIIIGLYKIISIYLPRKRDADNTSGD
jgi:hypothetical protein